ncbi:hypothetical protein [Corallococcus macrosporus]|uniref:Uncharacterized protein n=1 Tax=Myxococcus fulvus (strain ATCC BAA-855 / HW-1) TaxID=483219 RepID=F8C6J2_MYXFH|nr:hypothetical protein [Corallococcus macrosporus]AEI65581.1 hypothetical protein LILAB_18395 [Corallococcus macrosporus]
MQWYLVTYDVKSPHQSKVKDNLLARGFFENVRLTSGGAIRLPSTTLTVQAESALDAAAKFKKAVLVGFLVPGPLERYVVTPAEVDTWAEAL